VHDYRELRRNPAPEDDAAAPARGSSDPFQDATALSKICSGTPSSCRRAALALILATICLLANTPSCHPIGISCNTIVRLGCGRAANLARTALAMHFAAPRFLSNRPAHLPIGVSISTVVWVCRPDWGDRLHWHHWKWLRHHNWHLWTSQMVDIAAPSLLASTPLRHSIHCTIVGITGRHRPCWAWPWHWPWHWPRRWWCRWRCGRRCGCRRREGGG